jgi:hypothetical protein
LAKKADLNPHELLLAQTRDGYTAFHFARKNNHVETLMKMRVWAQETKLNPQELMKSFF